MTDDEKKKHSLNTKCENCKCEYKDTNRKIRHHDHITGNFICSLCNDCNKEFQYKRFYLYIYTI